MGGPGAWRGVRPSDQIVDVGNGPGPVDLGVPLATPALISGRRAVLSHARRLARSEEIANLQHAFHACRKDLLEVEVDHSVVRADLAFPCESQIPLVEPVRWVKP